MENVIQKSVQLLLNRHVENESSQNSPSILMVSSQLRDVSPNSFDPKVVSIGPLHREDVNVQAFERQKSNYLIKLVNRFSHSEEEILKTCMQKAYTWMERIKACYVWPKNKKYSDAEIAEMMVIDACFILEFTYQLEEVVEEAWCLTKMQVCALVNDMVLLENQIPLFFLNEIYKCTILKFRSDVSLSKLIGRPLIHGNINSIFPSKEINIDNDSISTAHHILSLVHQCNMPPDYIVVEEVSTRSIIHSATDLDRAGVNFKPIIDPTWVIEIQMKQHRRFPYFFGSTLAMPVLQVHDSTELILRNLVAYEQLFKPKMYFSSYVFAMDRLVNTQEDVAKLVDSGVIVNVMGSNEEAANMINSICKNIHLDGSFYEEEWKKVNRYRNGYWPKHIAWMRSTYFRSPWSIIALLAGIILFVLQVVQTIFTIKSYKISDK